jgi:hypothetical protein
MSSTAGWLSLTKVGTGFVFSQTHSIRGSQWPYIIEAIAHEFECDEYELECQEDDEGREFVLLHGNPIVEIHHCYMSNTRAA